MGDTEPNEPRKIGFLPSYLPDSTENSGADSPSHETVSPPYQSDLSSYDQGPPPYSPGLSTYDTEPPPYPSESIKDEDGTSIPPMTEIHQTIPSAPSVDQIDYRIGLTQTEREVILNALSNMRAKVLWKTQEEKNQFSQAENKVLELLHGVESKLTNSEKDEFLSEVRNINQIRNDEETRMLSCTLDYLSVEAKSAMQTCNNDVTMTLKIAEVTISIVIFFTFEDPKRFLNGRLILLFYESIGILATYFCICYWCNPKQSRTVRTLDCVFCIFSTIGCGLASTCFKRGDSDTGTDAFWTTTSTIVYGLDTLWKVCHKAICSYILRKCVIK